MGHGAAARSVVAGILCALSIVTLSACDTDRTVVLSPLDAEVAGGLIEDLTLVPLVAHVVLGDARIVDEITPTGGRSCGYALVETPATVIEVFKGTSVRRGGRVRVRWVVECPVRTRFFERRDVVVYAESVEGSGTRLVLSALENSTRPATPDVLRVLRDDLAAR